jgi:glycosyltransferase involved in cell wall biosynthesis
MANVLCYPQMSMYDKVTKELTPSADGNINMLRNTILEWKKHRPDDNFYILLPYELKKKLGQVLPDGITNCYPLLYHNYVISARINRFNFPMSEFISLLDNIKIDLILNDVIELTSNFQQLFNIEFGYKPKIISNIRHIDDVVNHYYMHRVLDGIMQSDVVTILSDSMKSKLDKQIQLITGGHVTANKVITFEPSISNTEIDEYLMNAKIVDMKKVIITFPGRLSIGEERRTNWDKFIEAINKLRNKRQDFEIYLTDPNSSLNMGLKNSDAFGRWVKTIEKDRHQFLKLLNRTDIIVSLMDVEGFGGISIREALLFGCRPVIPYVHEYKKMSPNIDYPGFIVSSPIKVDELVNALDKSIEFGKKNFHTDNWHNMGKQFTVEEQFKKLLPKLEEILND